MKIEVEAGHCYRLEIKRGEATRTHTVLVTALDGGFCAMVNASDESEPNLAAVELLPWANHHFRFRRLPGTQWPRSAQVWRVRRMQQDAAEPSPRLAWAA
ncbi:MAG: hypothetical protein FJ387_10895 [Verrucomicrobia bacterium]|nr:hypothetical protein [Verrucomicrobiota bacterium]